MRWRLGRARHYFRVIKESRNSFEVPWDEVLYHCEPEYEYHKGRQPANSPKERTERIGQRLRAERQRRRLTIAEVAERAGLQRPNLSRLEHGRHTPSLETLERIASALGIPVARLVATGNNAPT